MSDMPAVSEFPRKRDTLVSEDLEQMNEVLITDNADGSSFSLNLIAAAVLELCDGQHRPEDMASIISDTLKADPETVQRDVLAILEEFSAFGLLQEAA